MRDGTFCLTCSSFNPSGMEHCGSCGSELAPQRTAVGPNGLAPLPTPIVSARTRARRPRGARRAIVQIALTVPLLAALGVGMVAAGAQRAEENRFAARYAEAEAAEGEGRYALAAQLFADAAGYRDADIRAAAAENTYATAVGAGADALDAGRYDEAIALLDPLARQHPGDREIAALLAQAHTNRVNALLDSAEDAIEDGDWLTAERTYGALLAEDPANSEIAERLAWVQQEHAPILVGREDGIYLVGPDLDDERRIAALESTTQPVWSPDRTQVAFTVADEDQTLYGDLYVVGSDGQGLSRVARRVAAFRGVSWSPDGTSIAYSSFANYDRRAGGTVGLRMVDVATRVETDLTGSRWEYALSPTWSPDGKRLAFVHRTLDPDNNGGRDQGFGGVQVLDLETRSYTDLTSRDLRLANLVSWSPEAGSERLIVQTKGESIGYAPDPTDLYALDAKTGELTPIHTTRSIVTQAVWSPDGSRFAYVEEGEMLFIGFWQAGVLRQGSIKLNSPTSATLTWSPDGTALLLAAPDGWTPSLLLRFTPERVVQKQLVVEFRMDYAESAPPQWTSRNETFASPKPSGGTAFDTDGDPGESFAPMDRQRR